MKTNLGIVLTSLLVTSLAAPRAHAVAGIADTVIITGDLTWPSQKWEWEKLIYEARVQVEKTQTLIDRSDRMIELLGETHSAVGKLVGDVPDLLKPAEEAGALETEKHALQSGKNLFGVGSNAVKTHNTANAVTATYDAFGRTFKREGERYSHFAEQEAMYARYRTATLNADAVGQKELALQKQALNRLKTAKTDSEVAVFTATIAASQQRQDLAHQKATQAKSDLDALQAELVVEERRKAEADREWSQQVVARLRDKALAAYQAQVNGGSALASK
jgi:hypothetical protein